MEPWCKISDICPLVYLKTLNYISKVPFAINRHWGFIYDHLWRPLLNLPFCLHLPFSISRWTVFDLASHEKDLRSFKNIYSGSCLQRLWFNWFRVVAQAYMFLERFPVSHWVKNHYHYTPWNYSQWFWPGSNSQEETVFKYNSVFSQLCNYSNHSHKSSFLIQCAKINSVFLYVLG